MEIESWQLTDFNLKEAIQLDGRLGLQRVHRTDDGLLILVGERDIERVEREEPALVAFANRHSILAFVLDIGIRAERQLTYGTGFYFGERHPPAQSGRAVGQKDFDGALFDRLATVINSGFQSRDKEREIASIQLQQLVDSYNSARLLFPTFSGESYLGLMVILDALSPWSNAGGFATFGASVAPIRHECYCREARGCVQLHKPAYSGEIDIPARTRPRRA